MSDPAPTAASTVANSREQSPVDEWLVIEWTALANDLENQADRLEQFVDSLRQRASYAREKAKETQR